MSLFTNLITTEFVHLNDPQYAVFKNLSNNTLTYPGLSEVFLVGMTSECIQLPLSYLSCPLESLSVSHLMYPSIPAELHILERVLASVL